MPYRMFCDQCDKETPHNYVSHRATVIHQGWKAEITIAKEGVHNGGILCERCLHSILAEGKYESKMLQTRNA